MAQCGAIRVSQAATLSRIEKPRSRRNQQSPEVPDRLAFASCPRLVGLDDRLLIFPDPAIMLGVSLAKDWWLWSTRI
jgi:hypothetical protein